MHSSEYTQLPASISNLVSLQHLRMDVHSKRDRLAVILSGMSSIKQLELKTCPGIQTLNVPPSLHCLCPQLERLELSCAKRITGLTMDLLDMPSLQAGDVADEWGKAKLPANIQMHPKVQADEVYEEYMM